MWVLNVAVLLLLLVIAIVGPLLLLGLLLVVLLLLLLLLRGGLLLLRLLDLIVDKQICGKLNVALRIGQSNHGHILTVAKVD